MCLTSSSSDTFIQHSHSPIDEDSSVFLAKSTGWNLGFQGTLGLPFLPSITPSWNYNESLSSSYSSKFFGTSYEYSQPMRNTTQVHLRAKKAEDQLKEKDPHKIQYRIDIPFLTRSHWQLELNNFNSGKIFNYFSRMDVRAMDIPSEACSSKHKEFFQAWSYTISSTNDSMDAEIILIGRVSGRLNEESANFHVIDRKKYDGLTEAWKAYEEDVGRFKFGQIVKIPVKLRENTLELGDPTISNFSEECGEIQWKDETDISNVELVIQGKKISPGTFYVDK